MENNLNTSQTENNYNQPQKKFSMETQIGIENLKDIKKILEEVKQIKRFYKIEFILKHLISFFWIAIAIWGGFQSYNMINNFMKSDIASEIINISSQLKEVTNNLEDVKDMKNIIPTLNSNNTSKLKDLLDEDKQKILKENNNSSGILDILKNWIRYYERK